MAHVIPNLEEKSAETVALLIKNIQSGLTDDWKVLHSLNVVDSDVGHFGDIDLILISSNAVHGISLGRRGSQLDSWISKGWFDVKPDHLTLPSPVNSLRSWFTEALISYVPELFETCNPTVGIGFATYNRPGTSGHVSGKLLHEIDSPADSLELFLENLTEFWSNDGKENTTIPERTKMAVISKLREHMDYRVPLSITVGQIRDQRVALTQEQYALFDLFDFEENPRLLVEGKAGSGKTFCAIDLAHSETARGRKVLVACYNRRLASHLSDTLDPGQAIDIFVFHELCEQLAEKGGLSGKLDQSSGDLYTHLYPSTALEAIRSTDGGPIYDTLIVDEGQDLLIDRYIDVFDALLKDGINGGKWAFFFDPNQNIYLKQDSEEKILSRLRAARPFQHQLRINCRNTRGISDVASTLSGKPPMEVSEISGPIPDLTFYSSPEQQSRQVSLTVKRWLDQGIPLNDIVILSRFRLENSGLSRGLDAEILSLPLKNLEIGEPPTENTVIYSTIHSFKGLESEFVILTDLDRSIFRPESINQFYVGATRANALLELSISQEARPQIMEFASKLEAQTRERRTTDINRIGISARRRTRSGVAPVLARDWRERKTRRSRSPVNESDPLLDVVNESEIRIAESREAAEKYLAETPPVDDAWFGTWGPTVYEVRFVQEAIGPVPQITPSNTMATDVRAQTRLVGYAGSPTQLKLHIGLDDPGSYVFVKENGECETQYCPRFMISDVETADNVFLVDDNGHRVTLVRRSQAG